MTTITKIHKTYKYRLYPTEAQLPRLKLQLDVTRHWYNMCLEERSLAWKMEQRSVTKYDQQRNIKHYRKAIIPAQQVTFKVLERVCHDVDEAFQHFFRRVKSGDAPGYPKFKGWFYWNSFGFQAYGNGWRVDDRCLYVFGVGRIPVRWDRPMEGTPKTCRVKRIAGKWYVMIVCETVAPEPLPEVNRCVGIDVGISALITTSDGMKIDNPKWYREAQAELRRRQRKLARAVKGSNNRKVRVLEVQRQHEHIKNQRQDFINKLVHDLMDAYDFIAIEDLSIRNMVKNKHLSKSIMDAGWGYFRQRLEQKAVETGTTVMIVDARYTSKTCSQCGAIFENLTLADRWVTCDCGLSLDRDHNAAINILNRALV